MKFFLLLLLFALIVLVGIVVYFYFLFRHKLFFDMVYICKYLKNNITFNKNEINSLLTQSFESINKSSRYVIKNKDFFSRTIKGKEFKMINEYFSSLGKGDVGFEVNNLNYYEKTFEELELKTNKETKEKGLLYFKLIIGFGLIICVLLI